MKRVLKVLGLIALLIQVPGCERELPFEVPSPKPVKGYQIEGYVTDRLGVPIKGLQIALWYDYAPLDSNVAPSRSMVVDDSTKVVLLRVLDLQGRVIKVLFSGRAPLGELEYDWNKADSLGIAAPTGIYMVELRLGGTLKHSYIVVIDGAVTAVTDSLGHYMIPNDNLPVGFSPVPHYSQDGRRFLGNYRLTPYVLLEFRLDSRRYASVTLLKDQITRYDLRI